MDGEAFADALARILEKRSCMLKLMSMNIYDMELNFPFPVWDTPPFYLTYGKATGSDAASRD